MLLLAWPFPTNEGMAEDKPQALVAGPPQTEVVSVQGESASGGNPPQADGRPGGEDYEEADILEEELPIIMEGSKASAGSSAESATPDKGGGDNQPPAVAPPSAEVDNRPEGKVPERKGEEKRSAIGGFASTCGGQEEPYHGGVRKDH